jgi:hypothetical protein
VPVLLRGSFPRVDPQDVLDGSARAICGYVAHPARYDPARAPLDLYVAWLGRRTVISMLRARQRARRARRAAGLVATRVARRSAEPGAIYEAAELYDYLRRRVARTPAERALLSALRAGIRQPAALAARLARDGCETSERQVINMIEALRGRWKRARDGWSGRGGRAGGRA